MTSRRAISRTSLPIAAADSRDTLTRVALALAATVLLLGTSFAAPTPAASSLVRSYDYDAPAASTTHTASMHTGVLRGYDESRDVSRSHTAADELRLAAKPVTRGGESAATAFGRSAHKAWDPGPGFQKEFSIVEDGRVIARMDAINPRERIIKELKPDTSSGRSAGLRQLERYRRIAEEKFGGDWTVILETYKPPTP